MHAYFYVHSHNSKIIDPIYLKFGHKIECFPGSVLLEDGPDCGPDADFVTQYPDYGFSEAALNASS